MLGCCAPVPRPRMKPRAKDSRTPSVGQALGFLSPAQAAQELGVTRRFIDSRIADGEIGVCRPSSQIVRIRRAEWERWLDGYTLPARMAQAVNGSGCLS